MSETTAKQVPNREAWEKRIRQVHLLRGERVVGLLHGSKGLVDVPTKRGTLLALTDRRVVSLVDEEDRQEAHVATIDKIQGVSMRANQRSLKPLLQGVLLILAGVIVYLVVGAFSTGIPVNAGITIGALLGGAVALLGLLFILRYLFWEQGGELVFQTGGLELIFPYRSQGIGLHVHELLRRFFHLQTGIEVDPLYPHTTAPSWPPLLRMPEASDPPPPEETPVIPTTIVYTPPRDRRIPVRRRWRPAAPPRPFHRIRSSGRRGRSKTPKLRRNGLIRQYLQASRYKRREFRHLTRLRRSPMPALGRNGSRHGRFHTLLTRHGVR